MGDKGGKKDKEKIKQQQLKKQKQEEHRKEDKARPRTREDVMSDDPTPGRQATPLPLYNVNVRHPYTRSAREHWSPSRNGDDGPRADGSEAVHGTANTPPPLELQRIHSRSSSTRNIRWAFTARLMAPVDALRGPKRERSSRHERFELGDDGHRIPASGGSSHSYGALIGQITFRRKTRQPDNVSFQKTVSGKKHHGPPDLLETLFDFSESHTGAGARTAGHLVGQRRYFSWISQAWR